MPDRNSSRIFAHGTLHTKPLFIHAALVVIIHIHWILYIHIISKKILNVYNFGNIYLYIIDITRLLSRSECFSRCDSLYACRISIKYILLINHHTQNLNIWHPTFCQFFTVFIGRKCVRNLDLRVQVHPEELWVSKQRVQKVMSQRSAGSCTRCTRSNAFPDWSSHRRPIKTLEIEVCNCITCFK